MVIDDAKQSSEFKFDIPLQDFQALGKNSFISLLAKQQAGWARVTEAGGICHQCSSHFESFRVSRVEFGGNTPRILLRPEKLF